MEWYYDRYMTNNNLVAKLFHCDSHNTNIKRPFLTGILTSKYNFNVSHDWVGKADLISSIGVLFNKTIKSAMDFLEGTYKSGASKLQQASGNEDYAEASSIAFNKVIGSNQNLFKSFGGTKITIQPPTIEVYLIMSTIKDNIIDIIYSMFGSGEYNSNGLGGGFEIGPLSNVTTPPSQFRYTFTYNPNHYQKGSYKLLTTKFLMTNLVLSSMTVDFSDSIAWTKQSRKQPIYAKITLNFDWCITPNQQTIVKLLKSVPNMEDGTGDLVGDAKVKVYNINDDIRYSIGNISYNRTNLYDKTNSESN